MLATAAAGLPPDAAEFVAEVKWDGLRACVAVADGRVQVWSRTGRNMTAAYPELGVLAAVAGRGSWSWTVRSSPCPVRGRTSPRWRGG